MNPVFAMTAVEASAPFSERASTAGIVTLQGMVTIFLVLALLWGAVEILHKCFSKEKTQTAEKAETNATETLAQEPAADDGELLAVITAAIRATMGDSAGVEEFRVVSFRKSK